MPELPEVETVCNALRRSIHHQPVTQVKVRCATLRWPVPPTLPKTLLQHTVQEVTRRSKYILMQFDHGQLIIHLGMSGSIRLLTVPAPTAATHDHVDITFNNHILLRYRDPRRFGAILWTTDLIDDHPLLKHIGPEPLTAAFNGDYLWQQTRKHKINSKTLLMNSRIVAGVGNIYANEALFLAGIHPSTSSATLSLQQCEQLCSSIKQVLKKAIKAGGTTLNDFYHSDGNPGYFQQQLLVYGRVNQPCLHCKQTIQHINIQQRSSYYCPNCQPLAQQALINLEL